MRFRISHFLLFVTIVAVALVMRSVASIIGDERMIAHSVIAISIVATFVFRCLGSNMQTSIVGGTLVSAGVLAVHVVECLFHTPTTKYAWQYISGDIYLIAVPIILSGSLITSIATAFFANLVVRHNPAATWPREIAGKQNDDSN